MRPVWVLVTRLAALTPLAVPVVPGSAQEPSDSTRLDEIVVAASRLPQPARLRGVAADRIGVDELSRRRMWRLDQALGLIPGTSITRTGTPGGVASSFMRGSNSNQTLLLIDGVRVSDANLPPGSLLGGFELATDDQVEVVRGPQSTLYGGAAIGGVISIDGAPAALPTGLRASLDGGSFATYRGRVGGRARAGGLRVAATATFVDTDNQRPFNQYDQRTQSLRLSHAATSRLALAVSFRGLQQSYTSPGDINTTNSTPVGRTRFDNSLATASASFVVSPRWSTRLTTGWQHYFLRGTSQFNGGDEFVSRLGATRWVTDWQHSVEASPWLDVSAGVNAEWTTVDAGALERDERLRAAYVELDLRPTPMLTVSAGLRGDDYTTFGSAATGRLAVGWFLPVLSAKLRGSLGTGFLPPSLADRYGSGFQNPNAAVRPERSTGWDVGVDAFFAAGHGTIAITLFRNDLRDLIVFEPAQFPDLGRSVNVARARTQGIELSGRMVFDAVDLRAAYTHLTAESRDEPDPTLRRLIRRPGHALAADIVWTLGAAAGVGAGVVAALDRQDTDFNVFPFVRTDPGDYADGRLHGWLRLTSGLRLRTAVENIFDVRYQEVLGFPALGRRLTIGLDSTFDWM